MHTAYSNYREDAKSFFLFQRYVIVGSSVRAEQDDWTSFAIFPQTLDF